MYSPQYYFHCRTIYNILTRSFNKFLRNRIDLQFNQSTHNFLKLFNYLLLLLLNLLCSLLNVEKLVLLQCHIQWYILGHVPGIYISLCHIAVNNFQRTIASRGQSVWFNKCPRNEKFNSNQFSVTPKCTYNSIGMHLPSSKDQFHLVLSTADTDNITLQNVTLQNLIDYLLFYVPLENFSLI
jgi:hypothetical protein